LGVESKVLANLYLDQRHVLAQYGSYCSSSVEIVAAHYND